MPQRLPLPPSTDLQLADHSADGRMAMLALASLIVGTGGAFGAWALLKLIALTTNLLWFQRVSAAATEISAAHVGPWVALIPIAGALVIGAMARFGSEKIRGHGIPEAIEAIL